MTFLKLPIGDSANAQGTLNRWAAVLRRTRFLSLNRGDFDPAVGDALVWDGRYWVPGSKADQGLGTAAGQHITGITISAGSEVGTAHVLLTIPSMIIITYRQGGVVEDGPTPNTTGLFYLYNKSSSQTATVDVLVVP